MCIRDSVYLRDHALKILHLRVASSLVDFPLNVNRIGSGVLCWLWPVKHGCSLPSLLQGVPDEYWFLVIKGPLVASSLPVVECCLSFLSSLVSLLVEVIAWVFGLSVLLLQGRVVYVQTLTHVVMGLGHQVELFGISTVVWYILL